MRLLGLRVPHELRFYRGGLHSPVLLGSSPPLLWRFPQEPTGIHLAWHSPTSATVSWTTLNETTPAVFWASPTNLLFKRANASSSRLLRSDFPGDACVWWTPTRPLELASNATELGWLDSGTQHTATFSDLVAGSQYLYVVGNGDTVADAANARSFTMPPPPSTTFSLLVAADFGAAEPDGWNRDSSGLVASPLEVSLRGWDNLPSLATSRALSAEIDAGAGALLLLGDVSYARGFEAVWESFMFDLTPLASRVVTMTLPGNHEENWPFYNSAFNVSSLDSGGEAGIAYAHRFPMPSPSSLSSPWYSWAAGDAHIWMLSTEHDLSTGSPQLVWLAQDLQANSAAVWKIVAAHRFFFADSSTPVADAAAGAALLKDLEPLLLAHGVRLVLTGHHHSWQRTCPVVRGECDENGIVYIVTGNAGAGLSGLSGPPHGVFVTAILEHGYLRLTVNSTHLVGSARRSADGSELDAFVLTL